MMKKRVLTSIMAIILVISLTVPAFAATYSDLTNHWAKPYMEALATAGYITGYTDGTMKPDKNITYAETLTMLSRLYTLTDIQSETIEADYGAIAKANVPSTLSWAYKNIQICLASGIITETELKSVNLTANISKEQLAVYLIRAAQLTSTADALNNVQLTFSDAANVSSSCVGSVAELVTLGVVKGDEKNNFSPKSNVTRAVVATMLSRTLDYIKSKSLTLSIPAYVGLAKTEGIITYTDNSTLDICGFDSLTREYAVSSSSKIMVNGVSGFLSSSYVGCYAVVTTKSGTITNLAITSDSSVQWAQGTISTVSSTTSGGTVFYSDLTKQQVKSVVATNNTKITYNGLSVLFTSLAANNFVTIKSVNGTATEIYSVTGDRSISGTIKELKYGTTINIKIADSSGAVYCMNMSLSSLPTIKRNNTVITIDKLKVGGEVTLTIDDCKVSLIEVKGTAATVTGELVSITTNTDGTVWVIKNSSGTQNTYKIDEDTVAYNGTSKIALSAIQIGDSVTAVIYDDVITEVSLQSSGSTSTKVSGKVLEVDSKNCKITILTSSDKLVYVYYSTVGSIVNAKTGETLTYSSIGKEASLVAYGTYSDSKSFTAKSIIIE